MHEQFRQQWKNVFTLCALSCLIKLFVGRYLFEQVTAANSGVTEFRSSSIFFFTKPWWGTLRKSNVQNYVSDNYQCPDFWISPAKRNLYRRNKRCHKRHIVVIIGFNVAVVRHKDIDFGVAMGKRHIIIKNFWFADFRRASMNSLYCFAVFG